MAILLEKQDFSDIYELLEASFPHSEFREREAQAALFDKAPYRVYGLREGEKLLALCGCGDEDVRRGAVDGLMRKVQAMGEAKVAEEIGVGVPTLRDVVKELMKPGRDLRSDLPAPILRTDVLDMKDLKPGMVLTGTVRNVIDFGVFVDIGVHQDGLVHISQVCSRFIKHPSEVVAVGDIVKVLVLDVDEKKHRISLSMKQVKE